MESSLRMSMSTPPADDVRVASASRTIMAPAQQVFAVLAEPRSHSQIDGNDNVASAADGQRVGAVGDVFASILTKTGVIRENHVVEFVEGLRIAWRPAEPGKAPPGHLWRWELEPQGDRTVVTHTYDWTALTDEDRFARARATQEPQLRASLDRLADLVEGSQVS